VGPAALAQVVVWLFDRLPLQASSPVDRFGTAVKTASGERAVGCRLLLEIEESKGGG
jgi:hypothetical protein